MPSPKTFLLASGATYQAPPGLPESRQIKTRAAHPWNGSPQEPLGNPMLDGVGPASYSERHDHP
ncbi:hypothetical protein, partial [Enterococcus faecium]